MNEIRILTLVWLIAAVVGVLVQALLLWDERESLRALKRGGRNGAARLVALHDIRSDAIGLVILAIQVVIGVVIAAAVFAGVPPRNAVETWAILHAGQVLRYGLIASIVLAVASGIWKHRDRRQVFAAVLKEEQRQREAAHE